MAFHFDWLAFHINKSGPLFRVEIDGTTSLKVRLSTGKWAILYNYKLKIFITIESLYLYFLPCVFGTAGEVGK